MAFAFTVFVCTMIVIIMSIISIQVVVQAYKFKHTTDPIKLDVEKKQEHTKSED